MSNYHKCLFLQQQQLKINILFQENDFVQADKYAELAMSTDRYNPAGKLSD
jgi:hypothetical protein